MKELSGVSCIIPFYNERRYIRGVLNVLRRVKGISQIICVDDGSSDHTCELLSHKYPDVELVRLETNSGKSEAVRKGLEAVRSPYVLLADADLRGLRARDIQRAVNAVSGDSDIDMIILRRLKAPWVIKLYRIDTLLSGERLMKTTDLRKIYEGKFNGYQLETAINVYMQKHHKNVYWSPSSAMNTFKMTKYAMLKGLSKEFLMYLSLITHAGLFNVVRMVSRFGRQRLPYQPRAAQKSDLEAELAEE